MPTKILRANALKKLGFRKSFLPYVWVKKNGELYNTNPHRASNQSVRSRLDRDGYPRISTKRIIGGKPTEIPVHRIVAFAWVNGFEPGLCVNHKNGIRTDNCSSNLEWLSPADNERHSRKFLGKRLLGEKASRSKLSSAQVLRIRELENKYSKKIIAKKFSISKAQVERIIKRKNWGHL